MRAPSSFLSLSYVKSTFSFNFLLLGLSAAEYIFSCSESNILQLYPNFGVNMIFI